MTTLYFMRHAESVANQRRILASQSDYPLSEKGKRDAAEIAKKFSKEHHLTRIISSPLQRAVQTAEPFAKLFNLEIETNSDLIEQHLGKFTNMPYEQAIVDPDYQNNKAQRWNWVPAGGGESYEMIAGRIERFLQSLDHHAADNHILVLSHAVTMRLVRALLENSIPEYNTDLAENGEIWKIQLGKLKSKHSVSVLSFN
ncbi:histidine phosphatase family protein [candidate division KSB1 bacterium]|nr:histidine phosphatase family protein [candidate division KSB1 bacterium]